MEAAGDERPCSEVSEGEGEDLLGVAGGRTDEDGPAASLIFACDDDAAGSFFFDAAERCSALSSALSRRCMMIAALMPRSLRSGRVYQSRDVFCVPAHCGGSLSLLLSQFHSTLGDEMGESAANGLF